MGNRSEENQFWCQNILGYFMGHMPKELKQILLESRNTSSHCFDLSDCFTCICRIKKYSLESETSHALPAVSLCKNCLSNALQKDGQLKHHPLKVHEVVPLSLLLLVNRNTACVPGQCQRDAKTAVNIYLCYNWNQDACDRSHELKRTPVQMSPCELATFFMVTIQPQDRNRHF